MAIIDNQDELDEAEMPSKMEKYYKNTGRYLEKKEDYYRLRNLPKYVQNPKIIAEYFALGGRFDEGFLFVNPEFHGMWAEDVVKHMGKDTYFRLPPYFATNAEVVQKHIGLGGSLMEPEFIRLNPMFEGIKLSDLINSMTVPEDYYKLEKSPMGWNSAVIEKYFELGGEINAKFSKTNPTFEGLTKEIALDNFSSKEMYNYLPEEFSLDSDFVAKYYVLDGDILSESFQQINPTYKGVSSKMFAGAIETPEQYEDLKKYVHENPRRKHITEMVEMDEFAFRQDPRHEGDAHDGPRFSGIERFGETRVPVFREYLEYQQLEDKVSNSQIKAKAIGGPLVALSVLDLQRIYNEGKDSKFKDLYITESGIVTADAIVGGISLMSEKGQSLFNKLGIAGIVGVGAIEVVIGVEEGDYTKASKGVANTGAALTGISILAGTGAAVSTGGTVLLVMAVDGLIEDISNAINDMEHSKITKEDILTILSSIPKDKETLEQIVNPKLVELAELGQTLLKAEAIMEDYRAENPGFNPAFTSILDVKYTGAKQFKQDTLHRFSEALKTIYRESGYPSDITKSISKSYADATNLQMGNFKVGSRDYKGDDTEEIVNKFVKEMTVAPWKIADIKNPHLKAFANRIVKHNNEYKDMGDVKKWFLSFMDDDVRLADIKDDMIDFMEIRIDSEAHLSNVLDTITEKSKVTDMGIVLNSLEPNLNLVPSQFILRDENDGYKGHELGR